MGRTRVHVVKVLALLVSLALAGAARATSVQEIARLQGQGESVLQGLGLVIGLPGTGDTAEDLVVARPLFTMLERMGNPPGSLEELASSRSVALVVVTCTIPSSGAKANDTFDVSVSAVNNPESLDGGELFLTPLRGPLPGQPVYAIAQGPIVLESANASRGRVRSGARIVRQTPSWRMGADGTVTLVVRSSFAAWTTAQLLADTINQHRAGFSEIAVEIAEAVDDRTVRVTVPEEERGNVANFLADVLSIRFDPSLLDLPARVVVNEREDVIVATGDARFSPVSIAHGQIVISTLTPEGRQNQNATPADAEVDASDGVGKTGRVNDLLTAMRSLNVPVDEQIAIINQLHRSGALHAELVRD